MEGGRPQRGCATTDTTDGYVLVVDDEPSIRELLAQLLASEGYRCRCAADGAEALRAVEEELPCAVLLDLMLPRVDGRTVVRRLRAGSNGHAIPVIVISAASPLVHGSVVAEVDAYLRKPFDLDDLLRTMDALLSRPGTQLSA